MAYVKEELLRLSQWSVAEWTRGSPWIYFQLLNGETFLTKHCPLWPQCPSFGLPLAKHLQRSISLVLSPEPAQLPDHEFKYPTVQPHSPFPTHLFKCLLETQRDYHFTDLPTWPSLSASAPRLNFVFFSIQLRFHHDDSFLSNNLKSLVTLSEQQINRTTYPQACAHTA